jgi:aminoglycoside phosphotransferase (APT) family kinase protein
MTFVDGETIDDPARAAALTQDARDRMTDELTTVLGALHAQDPIALGLGGLVRPGAYVERQLRRWRRQVEDVESPASDLLGPVYERLRDQAPEQQGMAVVHGDFKLGNMRVTPDGAIAAVLDWELTAIGDPLADLGWLLASWAEPGDGGSWIVPPPTSAGGFPDRSSLVEAYAGKTGRDVSQVGYYVAFSYWRWSCINEGTRARFAAGAMGDRQIDVGALEAQIRSQLARAWELLA